MFAAAALALFASPATHAAETVHLYLELRTQGVMPVAGDAAKVRASGLAAFGDTVFGARVVADNESKSLDRGDRVKLAFELFGGEEVVIGESAKARANAPLHGEALIRLKPTGSDEILTLAYQGNRFADVGGVAVDEPYASTGELCILESGDHDDFASLAEALPSCGDVLGIIDTTSSMGASSSTADLSAYVGETEKTTIALWHNDAEGLQVNYVSMAVGTSSAFPGEYIPTFHGFVDENGEYLSPVAEERTAYACNTTTTLTVSDLFEGAFTYGFFGDDGVIDDLGFSSTDMMTEGTIVLDNGSGMVGYTATDDLFEVIFSGGETSAEVQVILFSDDEDACE